MLQPMGSPSLGHDLETEQQQGRLPSASVKNEPSGAETVDVQRPLRDFRLDSSTLCSRESGGARLKRFSCFQELISRFQSLHLFISVCAGLGHSVVSSSL